MMTSLSFVLGLLFLQSDLAEPGGQPQAVTDIDLEDLLKVHVTGATRKEQPVAGVPAAVYVLREVFSSLQESHPGRELTLELGSLPAAFGDPSMIRQVLANLIGNAAKYTRGKDPARIEVGARVEGDENLYYVRDNGVGFKQEYAHKLFGVFQRLHSAQEFEGTGVGLALVERIVQRHRGRVWGEGKVGEGATFSFSLPRVLSGGPEPARPVDELLTGR